MFFFSKNLIIMNGLTESYDPTIPINFPFLHYHHLLHQITPPIIDILMPLTIYSNFEFVTWILQSLSIASFLTFSNDQPVLINALLILSLYLNKSLKF